MQRHLDLSPNLGLITVSNTYILKKQYSNLLIIILKTYFFFFFLTKYIFIFLYISFFYFRTLTKHVPKIHSFFFNL